MADDKDATARPVTIDTSLLGTWTLDKKWFTPLKPKIRLDPGTLVPSKQFLTVPEADARGLLRNTQRLVADLPVEAPPRVVWHQGGSELYVDLSRTSLNCKVGLVTIGLTVSCDQLDRPTVIPVPIAVGTADQPTGLVMSSFSALDGPGIVVSQWTDALTAFAWETLVELARRLCADLGRDKAGHALVPGAIGSGSQVLLVQPMARFNLSRLAR